MPVSRTLAAAMVNRIRGSRRTHDFFRLSAQGCALGVQPHVDCLEPRTLMPESNLMLSPSGERRADERMTRRDRRAPAAELPSMTSPPLAASEAVIVLELNGDLAAVEREWKAFESVADCTAFQSFDWLAKWQQHIGARGGGVPAIVIGRDEDGRLL